MPNPLLPQTFWFRLAVPCQRIDALPRPGVNGRLLDLPDACKLPETPRLDGRDPWADVRVAWNPRGLAFAFEVTGKVGPIVRDPVIPDASDGVQIWIDTRDTRDIHRASRFCHRFVALLEPSPKGTPPKVEIAPKTIHRAQADPPRCRPEVLKARAESIRNGWRLEVFLPAEALHGFDPETNRRLGFAYQVNDPDRGAQFLGVGRDFPIGEDPSLWATLELSDNAP